MSLVRLPRSFYRRDCCQVAVDLLNKVLVHGDRSGRIVEVEAYLGSGDPASHSHRGKTRRNATMFGPAGHLYVYFTYGMHWCANVVCETEGSGAAVLIRALAPLTGVDSMWAERPAARSVRDLCSGPAKLTRALAINEAHDGVDLVEGELSIFDDGVEPPEEPLQGTRIGLSKGRRHPWRWWVADDPNVSVRRHSKYGMKQSRSKSDTLMR